MREIAGVVVAAGRGARFGGAVPKQFARLGGRTLVDHAVSALAAHPALTGVVVVLPPDLAGAPAADEARGLRGVIAVVAGGDARSRSVRLGIEAAAPCRYVMVHDAARPLASAKLVEAVVEAMLRHGAAIPVLPVHDTLKMDDGSGFSARTLDRSPLRLAQTPQGSRTDWLVEALDRVSREGIEPTDEAQALELAGRRVALVPGDPGNMKITERADLDTARLRVEGGARSLRVGTGFDIHRFAEGRPLVLGGVAFPGERGLTGHSDADVVLHAAMDALLGAAALGDIGVHFPPGDPKFAGASSTGLAQAVARMLRDHGVDVVNLDLTLLAERPRIAGRAAAMRGVIADSFGIEVSRVGLKATTLEGLGPLGREEGIACQAAALVCRTGEPV
jgi:2-C-methyl-D-erythritol 4-phosphate cytidylyltransferase / 2-C-methyl-D-erythritol 2,4-cyclodiphosphate synthase